MSCDERHAAGTLGITRKGEGAAPDAGDVARILGLCKRLAKAAGAPAAARPHAATVRDPAIAFAIRRASIAISRNMPLTGFV